MPTLVNEEEVVGKIRQVIRKEKVRVEKKEEEDGRIGSFDAIVHN